MRPNNSLRWLIITPAIFFAFTTPANAEPQPGLNAIGYTFQPTGIPTRDDQLYPVCHSEIENNINRNFNGEPFGPCPNDYFMVHYTGFITIPEHNTIRFMVAADDGGTVNIAGTEFGTWNIKGCSWSQQVSLNVQTGSQPLDGWFFEWGGGTCYMLAWNINETGWAIVPDEAFTRNEVASPTTTTEPVTTTIEPTTTTVEQTTTTVEQTTTTVEETTTTTEPATTTTSSTTSTTTTTVYVPPATTTTEPEPEPETTTTTEPVEETTTTEPEETTTTEPESEVTLPPDTTLPEPEEDEPYETTPETTPETLPEVESETPQPETTPEEETTPEKPSPTEETKEEESQPITVTEQPTPQQALVYATNPEILATITEEQAEEIFEALDITALDETQIQELVAAVQEAPTEVREAFEDTVDIFKNALDDYVPTGSKVPVGERRALIAIGAAIAAAGATRIRR